MARTILITRDGMWRVQVRRGLIGKAAIVRYGASTQRIFTSVFTVSRAVRYARKEAAKSGALVRA